MITQANLPGYRGTRADLLVAIKKSQPIGAKELADSLGVTPNALRRHLKELEAEGVVAFRREIRGVGGPTFAYSLTDSGERLFPNAYDALLPEALEMVRNSVGVEGVVALFRRRWELIAEATRPHIEGLPLAERTQKLADLLSKHGYMAEVVDGEQIVLREHHCTIRAVVERFPEICAAEQKFIQELLGVNVIRRTHIASGSNCCEYCLDAPKHMEQLATPAREPLKEIA